MLVLGADLSHKRTALVIVDSSLIVRKFEAFAIAKRPKWNLYLTNLFGRKLKALLPIDLCVIENNDHFEWYRPLFHAMLTACQYHNINTLMPTPSAVRAGLLGKGRGGCSKDEVMRYLSEHHEISFDDDPGQDLSDAAACAVWGVKHGS